MSWLQGKKLLKLVVALAAIAAAGLIATLPNLFVYAFFLLLLLLTVALGRWLVLTAREFKTP
jgi:hypothetical protein